MNSLEFFEWGTTADKRSNEVVIAIEGIEEELPINAYSSMYSVERTMIQNFVAAKNVTYAGRWGNTKIELLGKNTFKITGADDGYRQLIDRIYKHPSAQQGNKFLQFSLSFEDHKYYELITNNYTLEGFNIRYSPNYYSLPSLVMSYKNTNAAVVDLYNFRQANHPQYKYYYPFKFEKK